MGTHLGTRVRLLQADSDASYTTLLAIISLLLLLYFFFAPGGCNGQSYTMNYATVKGKFDEEVVDKSVRVLIEPGALLKIVGTRMDWKEDDISAEFIFTNPNAKSVCGCGESFNV